MSLLDKQLKLYPYRWMVAWLLMWVLVSALSPRDAGFDVLNYHVLNGWSGWNDRLGRDLAPADLHSFFNPTLNMIWHPLLGWPTILVGALQGLVQGVSLILLYRLSHIVLSSLGHEGRGLSMFTALLGFFSADMMELTASLRNDYWLTAAGLFALVCVVRKDGAAITWQRSAMGAFALGLMLGVKLTVICYALGFAAAVLFASGDMKNRVKCVAAAGVAALVGIALTGGWWYAALWHEVGNPLFPLMNETFQSPLGPTENFRDERFLAKSVWQGVAYPFISLISDDPVYQIGVKPVHLALMYVALPSLAATLWIKRGYIRKRDGGAVISLRPILTLLLAVSVILVAWTSLFLILRYIMIVGMLAPLFMACILVMWRPEVLAHPKAPIVLGALTVAAFMVGMQHGIRTKPVSNVFAPHMWVEPPEEIDFENSLVVFSGLYPSAYAVIGLPESAVFTSYYVQDWQAAALENYRPQIRDKIESGNRPVIAVINTVENPADVLSQYEVEFGLTSEVDACAQIRTSADGPDAILLACPLVRVGPR